MSYGDILNAFIVFAANGESGDSSRSGSGHSTPRVNVTSLPPGFIGNSNDGNDITIEGMVVEFKRQCIVGFLSFCFFPLKLVN